MSKHVALNQGDISINQHKGTSNKQANLLQLNLAAGK
jgi:hypothetical protein